MLDESYLLVDGPYATYERPLLISKKQADILEKFGYTILSSEQYKEVMDEIDRGITGSIRRKCKSVTVENN